MKIDQIDLWVAIFNLLLVVTTSLAIVDVIGFCEIRLKTFLLLLISIMVAGFSILIKRNE